MSELTHVVEVTADSRDDRERFWYGLYTASDAQILVDVLDRYFSTHVMKDLFFSVAKYRVEHSAFSLEGIANNLAMNLDGDWEESDESH